MKRTNIAGQRFGRLLFNGEPRPGNAGALLWPCICDCGNTKMAQSTALRDGRVRSCGCLKSEVTAARSRKHGLAVRGKMHPLYMLWAGMIKRCESKRSRSYAYYGGRGITVCERWRGSLEAFLSDMGERPSPLHSLDRIDNDAGYSPQNCRWATASEQCNNKRSNHKVELNGVTRNIAEWAREVGITGETLRKRLERGWPIEAAISPPKRRRTRASDKGISP